MLILPMFFFVLKMSSAALEKKVQVNEPSTAYMYSNTPEKKVHMNEPSAAYIQMHSKKVYVNDKNTMNPDWTADLGPYCLPYTLMKVFRINPEFRILRLTFHRTSASK